MSSPIPILRERILDVAEMLNVLVVDGDLRSDIAEVLDVAMLELIDIEREAWRRKGIRPKAPRTSPRMTPALKRKLRNDALAHPELPQHEIAERHHVNGGRVNEALNGYLTPPPRRRIIPPHRPTMGSPQWKS